MPAYAIPSGMSNPATAIPAKRSPRAVFHEHSGSQPLIGMNCVTDGGTRMAAPQKLGKRRQSWLPVVDELPYQPKAPVLWQPLRLLLVAEALVPVAWSCDVGRALYLLSAPRFDQPRTVLCRFCQYADADNALSLWSIRHVRSLQVRDADMLWIGKTK